MSFISPLPCDSGGGEGCCRTAFVGFCLEDSTPIAIIIENGIQLGWTNLLTGVFTPGPPPAGTTACSANPLPPLDCLTDSVTVCPPASGVFDVNIVNDLEIRALDCDIDSITVCPPVSGTFDVNIVNEVEIRPLDCLTDSVTVCQPEVVANFTSVAQNTSSVTVLAANPNRKGAIFWNNASSTAWIKFGATASQTSFSIRLVSETFYELNKGYTGVVDGIWLQAGAGAMRVTEFE